MVLIPYAIEGASILGWSLLHVNVPSLTAISAI